MAEHVDVCIIGAGLSGICAAHHLQDALPHKSYAVLEARGAIGGTWDLFKYPGVRSDSDMFTLGFGFKPWTEAKAIADGPSILRYVRDTATDAGIDDHLRLHHRVVRAAWSTADARWTVEAERTDTGERVALTCGFLFSCTGYYRYDEGYRPAFPGEERFAGPIVHPQHWDEGLDYDGKRVVVIGSGATAVTLIPAMAERAAHMTMLQRSPSYILSLPASDPIADALRKVLPPRVAHPVVRWKNVLLTRASYHLSRRRPALMRKLLRRGVTRQLPAGYEVDRDFNPSYDPWDQRLCLVPGGDLFETISAGKASVVTDQIETFTEDGIRLRSGRKLEADVVITATGLNLLPLGGIQLAVDGEPVELPRTLAYKGAMLGDVPNFAFALGYTNASWTLKCELICQYVCRLLRHMDERGARIATPRPSPEVQRRPFIDLTSGYVQRSLADFPQQGAEAPWRAYQNYLLDVRLFRRGPVDDAMEFAAAA
jgi:monooxygenase